MSNNLRSSKLENSKEEYVLMSDCNAIYNLDFKEILKAHDENEAEMFNNKKISVAMTTYNGEKYLSEQLDSILSQTVTDFELIICDDFSQDKTLSILNEYASKYDKIKVFQNAKLVF